MKQQILFVSHCFFNDSTKLKNQNPASQTRERSKKRAFLKQMLDGGVELIQLPCPEFILYGSNRWGHASSQFDTPFFRKEARNMLEPYLLQLEEYNAYPDRFDILGIMGINGSPSCGVDFTYDGKWGGEFSGDQNLTSTLNSLKQESKPGVFMDVLTEMLHERRIPVKLYSLETFPYPIQSTENNTAQHTRSDAAQVDLSLSGNSRRTFR